MIVGLIGFDPVDSIEVVKGSSDTIYLILKNCGFNEMKRFITMARKNMNLNFLIHRNIFSNDDIEWIEVKAPLRKL